MKRRWITLLVLLSVSCVPSLAGTLTSQKQSVPYTALVAVDNTALEILIDFNADGVADNARMVSIFNAAGDPIYCTTRGTATAVGAPLTVGTAYSFPPEGSPQSPLVNRLSCLCGVGNTATLHIWAYP